ncbi:helicase, partial [Mesorhizobium sp. B2-4-19]
PTPALRADPPHEGQGEAGEPIAEAEAPKPILLWRQGRFEQRPRHHEGRNNRQRNGQARGRGNAPAEAGAAQTTGAPGERPAHEGRRDSAGKPRFDRSKFKPKPQDEGEQRRDGRPQGERREGRPDWKGGRPEGKGGPDRDKGGAKPAFQPKPREERPVRFDPDSPFAKLAALRDQLKK